MSPKGFKGKYFSLAAILAFSTTSSLYATQVAQSSHVEQSYEQNEKEQEEEPTLVISKKLSKVQITSASNALQNRANITDNATVITSNELSLMGAKTVIEALNYIAGFSSTASGGMGQSTTIRVQGMNGKYVLVLLNGAKYGNPFDTSGANLANLMIDDVERIEVIKGAQSAIWGADAAAGVINIITKKADEKTATYVSVEAGNYGYKKASASFSYANEKIDTSLSVLRVVSDELTAVFPSGKNPKQFEKDPYRNTTLNFNGGYWINSENRVEFNYIDINAFNNYDDSGDPDSTQRMDYREHRGGLRYLYFVGSHLVGFEVTKSKVKVDDLDAVGSLWGENVAKNSGEVLGFAIKDEFRYGENSLLVLGANHEEQKINYTMTDGFSDNLKRKNKALFVSNTLAFEKLNLTTALRYDKADGFGSKVTYKVGASYNIFGNISVYANAGTAYRAPTLNEIVYPWGNSNYELKPENITSYNAGFRGYGFELNLFRNSIKDFISWSGASDSNVNIDGNTTFKGVELSYEDIFYDKFLVGGSYTYVSAKEEDGTQLTRIPQHKASILLGYLPTKSLKISFFGDYIGKRVDQDFSSWPSLKVDTGRYFLANAKVDYAVNKNLDVYTNLNNILNKEYQEVYGYSTKKFNFTVGFRAKF